MGDMQPLKKVLLAAAMVAAASCATRGAPAFDAYGYLSPQPTGEGRFIGSYATKAECAAAADAWTTQQVVGNPVSAQCYPVDRR